MLLIHKPHSYKKLFFLVITSICIIGALLGFYGLTYTPELSHAETVIYPEKEIRTMANITYMQEVNPQICANTPEADTAGNNQYQLKDSRDQKTYWVAKLKDGNCWMTQNLDLDLSTSKPLLSIDSDLPSSWTPPEATQTTTSPNFGTANNNVKSWDPAQGRMATYCNNGVIAGQCKTSGNPTTSVNDGHDAQGNYYSWGAATAGQAAILTSTEIGEQSTQSICPKGWSLPTSGANDRQYNMLVKGLNGTQLIISPYYFICGGWIDDKVQQYFGSYGLHWSSTASNASTAYNLNLSNTVRPSYSSGRYFGFSVRCVARTESVQNNNVEIAINNTISLDVTNEVEIKKSDTNPSTAAFSALVASNQPYSVSISSTNPNMTSSTSSTAIPSKSGTLTSNDNAWGIKLSTASTYEQITATPKLFYPSSNPESKTIPFTIGISTAPDIPNGEYSTDITITATQN